MTTSVLGYLKVRKSKVVPTIMTGFDLYRFSKKLRYLNLVGNDAESLGCVLQDWFNSPFFRRSPNSAKDAYVQVKANGIICERQTGSCFDQEVALSSFSLVDEYILGNTSIREPYLLVDKWIQEVNDIATFFSFDDENWKPINPSRALKTLIYGLILDDTSGLVSRPIAEQNSGCLLWIGDETVFKALTPSSEGKNLRASIVECQHDSFQVSSHLYPTLQLLLPETDSIYTSPLGIRKSDSRGVGRFILHKGHVTLFRVHISRLVVLRILKLPQRFIYRLHALINHDRALPTWRLTEMPMTIQSYNELKSHENT